MGRWRAQPFVRALECPRPEQHEIARFSEDNVIDGEKVSMLGTSLCFPVSTPDTTDPIRWATAVVSHRQQELTLRRLVVLDSRHRKSRSAFACTSSAWTA